MLDDVPPALARILEEELAPGEQIVWHARPSLGALIQFQLVCVACGLLIAIATPVEIRIHQLSREIDPTGTLLHRGTMILDFMFGLTVFMAVFILWFVWRRPQRVIYAITNRRAIMVQDGFYRRIQSFTGEQLVRIFRRETRSGRGDIFFERNIAFIGIANVKAVEQLLRQTYQATHSDRIPRA